MSDGRGSGSGPPEPLAHATAPPAPEEPPPLSGRWGILYALVIAELAAVILFCYWISGRHP